MLLLIKAVVVFYPGLSVSGLKSLFTKEIKTSHKGNGRGLEDEVDVRWNLRHEKSERSVWDKIDVAGVPGPFTPIRTPRRKDGGFSWDIPHKVGHAGKMNPNKYDHFKETSLPDSDKWLRSFLIEASNSKGECIAKILYQYGMDSKLMSQGIYIQEIYLDKRYLMKRVTTSPYTDSSVELIRSIDGKLRSSYAYLEKATTEYGQISEEVKVASKEDMITQIILERHRKRAKIQGRLRPEEIALLEVDSRNIVEDIADLTY